MFKAFGTLQELPSDEATELQHPALRDRLHVPGGGGRVHCEQAPAPARVWPRAPVEEDADERAA